MNIIDNQKHLSLLMHNIDQALENLINKIDTQNIEINHLKEENAKLRQNSHKILHEIKGYVIELEALKKVLDVKHMDYAV